VAAAAGLFAALSAGAGTSAADPSFQPAPPIQAAFFYPWFPNAWTQGVVYPYTNYSPSLGFYDSADDSTIDRQLELARQSHIEAFIASWWGKGHHTDAALQHILGRSERSGSPYPDLRWAVYYEEEGYSDPPASEIVADLQYLAGTAFSHPSYLEVNGRPVVFVWSSGSDGSGMAARWAQAKAQFPNVYVVLKVYSGYKTEPNQPDSWHQYGPASAYDSQAPYSATVSPGFWKKGETTPRLGRDLTRFEADVKRMAATGAFWQLLTTWNEWGEGTGVEPAAQFGTTYVDVLCGNLPGDEPCATPMPTPGPDADGDQVPDASDNCPNWPNPAQLLPPWTVPIGDPDCDGWATGNESSYGTLPLAACPATSAANDEPADAWPPDFNDNRSVEASDLLGAGTSFKRSLGSSIGDPNYNRRFDFNANATVDVNDLLGFGASFKSLFGRSCVP
jgi:hypothetical protein